MKLKGQPFKVGKRTLGKLYEVSGGRQVYLAHRKVGDIQHGSEKCIADAIRKGVAYWGVEESVVLTLRARGVAFIGVLVKETGDRFLARTSAFFEYGSAKMMTVRGRGMQRCVPLSAFTRRPGKIVKSR